MLSVLNVAMPAIAFTVAVPASVPFPGLAPIATVTEAVLVGTRLPYASRISNVTSVALLMTAPAVVVVGCTPKTRRLAAPGSTATAGLESAVLVPSVMSLTVAVWLPAVGNVTANVRVPAARAAFGGRVAFASLDVMPNVSVTELTTFQFASTAFTVTLNAVPAARDVGVPVLPAVEPGAAVSPGSRICSFVNAPGLTVVAGLVLGGSRPGDCGSR